MASKKEKEYQEVKKMAENAGIADLMKVYGEYKKLMEMSNRYLKEISPKYIFSTTNSTT